MTMEQILLGFSKLKDEELEKKATIILLHNNNSNGHNPAFRDVIKLEAALKAFREARDIFIGYESVINTEKATTREQLLKALSYVGQATANKYKGDSLKIASTGYVL